MNKTVLGWVISLAALSAGSSFAAVPVVKTIDARVSAIRCQQLEDGDSPVSVYYDGAKQSVQVIENAKITMFDVQRLMPNQDGSFVLVGYNDDAGYIQMNVIPGSQTMMLIGSYVSYLSCSVE